MFNKILIANRGEIACRIIKTARRMGIRTVAVYSEADARSLHVHQADEAVAIGPAPAAHSYLVIDSLIRACLATGAEAVHPGYGFLAENATFAQRLADAGLVFIGPSPSAISSMGDKIAAKKLAHRAGVPTIPGHAEMIGSAGEAVEIARALGYPVMIKASAGGGGKGMRLARDDDQCRDGFERAASEARSAFGDDRVLIEKYIDEPRHIEIQVLADRHGNVLHLGERECTLQRRHQKVIEEAPSPFLDDSTRHAMGAHAVALARAANYVSAGTVEFIVDADRNFYFLEMNTRLQVEHPVTEFITGLDLVELMIRIAAGEALPLDQDRVPRRGWAIEARVYAEDPSRNFLPSTGRLVRYRPPDESPTVRVDSGVYEGADIPVYYDPLIAKLITHGATRQQAIEQMLHALNVFCVQGVSHNISFLAALTDHPRFRSGAVSTHFIAQEYPGGFHPTDVGHRQPALLVTIAAAIHRRHQDREAGISGQLAGSEYRVPGEWVVALGAERFPVRVTPVEGGYEVVSGAERFQISSDWQFGQPLFKGTWNGVDVCVQVERRNLVYRLYHGGSQTDAMVLLPRAAELLERIPPKPPRDSTRQLVSPMPGLLAQLLVGVGSEVKLGQQLAIVEAMKMENVLCSERNGKVARILAAVGDTLTVEQPILEFE
jgi:propionyl-CoA carboxylase alpha chain